MSHEDDLARAVEALRRIIRTKGHPLREVDRRMSRYRGWTGKNLGDSRDLKLVELLELLDVLEVPPGAFFAEVFPNPEGPLPRRVTSDPYVRRSEVRDLFRELLKEMAPDRRGP